MRAALDREAPSPDSPRVVPLDLSLRGLGEVSRLFAAVWPRARHLTADYLDWAYNRNPDGPAIGFNAVSGGRVVAHYAVQPMLARLSGGEEPGVLSVNTAALPDVRGTGISYRLARASYARAREEGKGFVIGVTNAMGAPLAWREKFQAVGPLEVWAGFGSPPVDESRAGAIAFRRVWSPDRLRWRLGRPGTPYRLQRVPGGIHILRAAGFLGFHVDLGFVEEASLAEGFPCVHGLSPFRVWAGLDPRRHWKAFGRVAVPLRFRPSPLHVIFKDLTPHQRKLNPDAMLMTFLDFDAF